MLSVAISSASDSSSPSSDTGTPASNPITTSCGAGACAADDVSANASSGGATHGSSSIPASIARPKRLSSIEYGDSCFASTGIPRASAYAISSSRDQMRSRSGAITRTPGKRALNASSNRSWSLPFPVQPCTVASAPTSSATPATASAITGRESAETSGYFPS